VPVRSTTAVVDNDEPPPPLPEKSPSLTEPQNDYANVGGSPQSRGANAPPPVMRRSTHRSRVCISLTLQQLSVITYYLILMCCKLHRQQHRMIELVVKDVLTSSVS